VSGSVHYFRIHPGLYQDRLTKAKMGGLNTVQTLVPWNFNNPEPGVYNFSLITHFLDLAKETGLLVTLRPGPYVCGEWEFGGFPYWLLQKNPDMVLRSSDPEFLDAVAEWYSIILPVLKPYLYSNGGNVILVQVENEYGSYGNDKVYLSFVRDLMAKYLGEGSVIFHSTDGNDEGFLMRTYIPGVYQTVDFGPGQDPADAFSMQQDFNKVGPYMNSEFYTGWLTHWGDAEMANVSTADVVKYLNELLAYKNASVNMYMYHGGTNFGFWNGANGNFTFYQPQVTSYDYLAPVSEAGDPTEKYFLIRDVISMYEPVPSGPLPDPSKKGNYGTITLNEQVSLFAPGVLAPPFTTPIPTPSTFTFERMGVGYGFVLYRTNLTRELNTSSTLTFTPKDRAWVYLDGEYLGLLYNGVNSSIGVPALMVETAVLDILVENMGRINYGRAMTDFKGLGPIGVICDGYYTFGWVAYPLPLTDLSSLQFEKRITNDGPTFFRGYFNIDGEPMDTFFNMEGWSKGNVFINGFNLGRYWHIGPQLSLYVPAPVLVNGVNEVIVFETEGTSSTGIISQENPVYS